MSQHDFVIANQGFPNFRSDLNNGLQALASVSAGASEPGTIYAYQLWLDTSTTPSTLKQRNGDNDAWITILYIDQTNDNVEFPAIESRLEDATNNNVSYPLNIIHETSGTPAAGIGTGIKLTTETAAGNNETGAIIEAVVTDASSGAEDFDLVFKTMSGGSTASERLRIFDDGSVRIKDTVLFHAGAQTPSQESRIDMQLPITGNTASQGIYSRGEVSSDVTTSARCFLSAGRTEDASFNLTNLEHYYALQGTIGAASTVTSQSAFKAGSNLTGATNNYGLLSLIPSGSGRWNIYCSGTAPNYLAGGVNIGSTGAGAWIDDSSHGSTSTTMYIGNQSINTTSDYRLKTNIVNTEANALNVINNLRVVDFEWDDPTDTSWNNKNARGKWTGLIAQEAINHIPYVVNAPRNQETMEPIPEHKDCHGNNVYWFIEYQHMVPMLVKAIQELTDRLNALESQN